MSHKGTPWPWYAAAVFFFILDRLFKNLALAHFARAVGSPASFILFMNHGVAFSLPVPAVLFWPAAVLALLAIVTYFILSFRQDPAAAAALFFVIVGALSNLIDRLHYNATVDYFLFFQRSAVNIADGMVIGGLLFLLLRRKNKAASH